MTQIYEGMFLLDNQAVRTDWGHAKAAVTDALAKHGAKVLSARRWDERRLAYPIKGRQRGTYLLSYFELDGARAPGLRRDLDIEERVLRYLILSREALPEGEVELSQAELAEGFSVPPPPADDEPLGGPAEEQAAGEGGDDEADSDEDEADSDADSDGDDERPTTTKAKATAAQAGDED